MVYVKFTASCDLRADLRIYGHPSQVCTQVLVLQTCFDLRLLASPFVQGFIVTFFEIFLSEK